MQVADDSLLELQKSFSVPVQNMVIPGGSVWKYNTRHNYQYIIDNF